MKFFIEAVCDKGCVRDNNEDKILIPGILFTDDSHNLEYETSSTAVFAVADGMGGHNAGEVASELVLESLEDLVSKLPPGLNLENLKYNFNKWVQEVHKNIIRIGIENPKLRGMGTTLTGILHYHDSLYSFNAGDSRCYRFRDGIIRQLTTDHTLAQATKDPKVPGNILLNSVGGGQSTFIDLVDLSGRVLPHDLYLLCSDGLSDLVCDDEIERHLKTHQSGIKELVELAKNRGGKDNISVVSIKVF